MDTIKELQAHMARTHAEVLAKSILANNALLNRLQEQQREWDALPWHAKLRRRIAARYRGAVWRVSTAWRVLRTGEIE
jgi:hypothetical protein